MKKIYIIIIAHFLFTATRSQDVTVTASFDSSRIFLGDQINFSIVIEQPSDVSLRLPLFKDTLAGKIEILKGPMVDTIREGTNRLKITERYLVTSFDSGFYQVPPVFAELGGEKEFKRFYSDYSSLEVARVGITPPDSTAMIFDIVAPYQAPLTFKEMLPWIVIGLITSAVLFFLVRAVRKKKMEKTVVEEIMNPEPAHVIAFRDLDKLKEEQLWQKGEVKKYYTRLTEILRRYLENRYNILSLELTTHETLDSLVRIGFKKDETYVLLENLLTGGDLVKFAKYRPEPGENELHLDNSYKFVDATKMIEVPLTEADGKTEESEKPEKEVAL